MFHISDQATHGHEYKDRLMESNDMGKNNIENRDIINIGDTRNKEENVPDQLASNNTKPIMGNENNKTRNHELALSHHHSASIEELTSDELFKEVSTSRDKFSKTFLLGVGTSWILSSRVELSLKPDKQA